jgi:AAA domain/Phage integrase family
MLESWNEGVRGAQVPPLINSDADTIRCVAGPGSDKTFGLVRRIERIIHPEGLAVDGHEVLVVAFNRVIARQLREDIGARLKTFEHTHDPVIRTIHALCVEVIREELKMLLPHEVDAMIYDVLNLYPAVAKRYDNFRDAQQALRDHEAGHREHHELWQGARQWLVRHKAHLVSDLPRLLLARLKGGDFPEQGYDFVIVDEFQDLTAGEQELMFRLRRPGGQLVALGDPRQSIYTFRGNDRQGLAKLESLVGEGDPVTDVAITECQRWPEPIVVAANKLMALSGVEAMVQYERLLTVAHKRGHDAYLMVLLGVDAGFRLGEIVALEWGDVDLHARRLTVQRSDWLGHVTVPKSGRSRRLPMTRRLTAALKAHRHLRSDRVFCLPDGTAITRDRVIKAIRGAQRVGGLSEAGVHVLRHTFCSAPGDARRAGARDPGAGGTRGSVDDAAIHAPEYGGDRRRDSVVGRASGRPRKRRKFWRHSGHAIGEIEK